MGSSVDRCNVLLGLGFDHVPKKHWLVEGKKVLCLMMCWHAKDIFMDSIAPWIHVAQGLPFISNAWNNDRSHWSIIVESLTHETPGLALLGVAAAHSYNDQCMPARHNIIVLKLGWLGVWCWLWSHARFGKVPEHLLKSTAAIYMIWAVVVATRCLQSFAMQQLTCNHETMEEVKKHYQPNVIFT